MTDNANVDVFLERATELIDELGQQARQQVAEAEQKASDNIAKWHQLRDELSDGEDRLVELRQLLEQLPVQHSRAILAEDPDEEDRVKGIYQKARAEVEALEARLPAIRIELSELSPRTTQPGGHPHDVAIYQLAAVGDVYMRAVAPLDRIKDAVQVAVRKAAGPLDGAQEQRRGRAESLHNARKWERNQRQEHQEAG